MKKTRLSSILATALLTTASLHAADYSQWGGGNTRNMVSDEKGLPIDIDPGKKYGPKAAPKIAGRLRPDAQAANKGPGAEDIDMSTTKNCLWVAKLGSQTYGTPMIANGKVYVGTNNETPRDKRHVGDRSILLCLDEKTGRLNWQLVVTKLKSGKVNDWENLGLLSSPLVVGNRVYLVTSRCEVLCLDAEGMASSSVGGGAWAPHLPPRQ